MSGGHDRDAALSEPIAGLIIILLAIACVSLVVVLLIGVIFPEAHLTPFAPVTDFVTVDGKVTMRVLHGGGDSVALTDAREQGTVFHLKMYIETREGLYEVIPDRSLQSRVFSPGNTLLIYRAFDSYRFTDSAQALVPAGSLPDGPFSLRFVDDTHKVTLVAMGENGWSSVVVPVKTPEVPAELPQVVPLQTPVTTLSATPLEVTPATTPAHTPKNPSPEVPIPPTPSVRTPFPTMKKVYPVYLNTHKRGYLAEGSAVRFRVTGQYSYVRLGSMTKSLSYGDEVILTMATSEGAKISISSSMITTFSADDVLLTVNGVSQGRGRVTDIHIGSYSDIRSTLSLYVPTQTAETDFRFNGVQLFQGVTDTPVTIDGLVPGGPNAVLNLDSAGSSTYLDGAATGYVLA